MIVVPEPKFDPIYRRELLGVIQAAANANQRNAQQEIGPSGVGGCETKIAFGLAFGAASDGDNGWAAHKGTVLHAWLDTTFTASERLMPDGSQRFMTEMKLESSAPGLISGGTVDLYDRLYQRVVDWKAPGDFTMDKVRSGNYSEGYYVQSMVYGYHLSLMGHPVATTSLAFLPMAGDDLWGDRRGAIFAYWDFDPRVAIDAINNVRRIKTIIDLVPFSQAVKSGALDTRSDFCQSCPAHISSTDRRGICPGVVPTAPTSGRNLFS